MNRVYKLLLVTYLAESRYVHTVGDNALWNRSKMNVQIGRCWLQESVIGDVPRVVLRRS